MVRWTFSVGVRPLCVRGTPPDTVLHAYKDDVNAHWLQRQESGAGFDRRHCKMRSCRHKAADQSSDVDAARCAASPWKTRRKLEEWKSWMRADELR